MKHGILKKKKNTFGISIVEVMLVLAIVSLIFVVIAAGASELQKSRRDSYRKAYVRAVYAKLEEFYKNNKKFPGCASGGGCNLDDIQHFMEAYMPDGHDPSTGKAYNSTPVSVTSFGTYNGAAGCIKSANGIAEYCNWEVAHNWYPQPGKLYIGTAHWCYSSQPDPGGPGSPGPSAGPGPPLSGDPAGDNDITKFVIVTYLERGAYYCLDNFTGN